MTGKRIWKAVTSKEVITFLVFLIIAAIMWFMYTVGTQREVEIKAPVVYYGIPDDVKLREPLPAEVGFTIRDEGSQLWSYLLMDVDTLEVDLADQFSHARKREIKVNFEPYVAELAASLSSSCEVVEVRPAVYQSRYESVHTRRVPIRLAADIKIDKSYMAVSPVTITPAEVLIRGVRRSVDSVQYIQIDSIGETVTKSRKFNVRLRAPAGVELLTARAEISVRTERATEKSFTLPIEQRNTPEGEQLHIFPKDARVVCRVGLSRYKALDPAKLHVIFDYNTCDSQRFVNTLRIESDTPLTGVECRIEPQEVEYLIEKL